MAAFYLCGECKNYTKAMPNEDCPTCSQPDAWEVERRLEIRRTLDDLYHSWIQRPELRLGQLLKASWGGDTSFFYVGDAELATGVRTFVEKPKPAGE